MASTVDGVAACVLASASPQRRAILGDLGVSFLVRPTDVDELAEGAPADVAIENARRKARAAAAAALSPATLVIGCDTVVAADERLWGKPHDRDAARTTLTALAGRRHEVVSGLCLIRGDVERVASERTGVWFRELGERAIERYLDAGEWEGRAGGYAVQGVGATLVARIDGSLLNVIGLPVGALLELEPALA